MKKETAELWLTVDGYVAVSNDKLGHGVTKEEALMDLAFQLGPNRLGLLFKSTSESPAANRHFFGRPAIRLSRF